MYKIVITGAAGFIGSHLLTTFSKSNFQIIATDKTPPATELLRTERFKFVSTNHTIIECDITDFKAVQQLINTHKPDLIIHLAAATGIAESLTNPQLYFDTNVVGFYNVIESARQAGVKKLIYASSSSVYPANSPSIFTEDLKTDNQLSFYGSTKKTNEILANSYATNFGMNCIGLRFFTVYGSWVRSDMAGFKFMNALVNNQPITLYNDGNVYRDFTHVNDIVRGIQLMTEKVINDNQANDSRLFNIGFGNPNSILEYLNQIAFCLNVTPTIITKPLPVNELISTHASTAKLVHYIDYKPNTTLNAGVTEMTNWFINHIKKS